MDIKIIDSFLNESLVPGLLSIVNADLYLTVHDSKYEVIFTTNKSAISNSLSGWRESLGTSYAAPPLKIIEKLVAKNKDFTPELIIQASRKIYEIQQEVFITKKTIRFIDMLPYDNTYQAFLSCISPICFPGSELVIGILTISEPFPIIGVEDLFKLKNNKLQVQSLVSLPKPPYGLSSRQWEILFLLSIGLGQATIANLLNIKRGTVSKIIREVIFDKFKTFSIDELVAKSIKLGLNKIIPQTLWKYQVIMLD